MIRVLISTTLACFLVSCGGETKSVTVPAFPPSPPVPPDNPANPVVEIVTDLGTIKAELFQDKSPKTVANFLKYVESKHFDNTIFHRVMKKFMIQGGGFEKQAGGNLVEKATLPPVENEASNGLKNKRGRLAMARTNDPHSATAQFFINTVDNNTLDKGDPNGVDKENGYAVFGKVLAGMEVVDQIEIAETGSRPLTSRGPRGELSSSSHENVPLKDIVIQTVKLVAPATPTPATPTPAAPAPDAPAPDAPAPANP